MKRPGQKRTDRLGGGDIQQHLALAESKSTLVPLHVYRCELVEERTIVVPALRLGCPATAAKVLRTFLATADREQLVVLMFDSCRPSASPPLIGAHIAAIGTQKSVDCDPCEVLKAVLLRNAAGFLVGHNHIRGAALPSVSDRKMTRALKRAADFFGLDFYDHIIIATAMPGEEFYSFAEHGAL